VLARWLTGDAPGALAVLRTPALPALLDRKLPSLNRSIFARFLTADGGIVDEVVATRLADGLELTPHGGSGVRAAITTALAGHGITCQEGPAAADAWGRLAAAAHPAAVHRLLADPQADHPLLFRQPVLLIAGPANAGKSTLINAWSGQQRVLVSPEPGTTRDSPAVTALTRGWRLRLHDTAGLRPTDDALERAGQALGRSLRTRADLVLWLAPGGADLHPEPGDLVVAAKADLGGADGGGLRWSDRLPETPRLLDVLQLAVLERLGLSPDCAGTSTADGWRPER
jgi:hypothetical protein